jgi:hypothetical protein
LEDKLDKYIKTMTDRGDLVAGEKESLEAVDVFLKSKHLATSLTVEYETSISQLHFICVFYDKFFPNNKPVAGTQTCQKIAAAAQIAYDLRFAAAGN